MLHDNLAMHIFIRSNVYLLLENHDKIYKPILNKF